MSPENRCPKCGAPLLLFRSIFKKVCVDCREEYSWHLKPDQQPLIKHQR